MRSWHVPALCSFGLGIALAQISCSPIGPFACSGDAGCQADGRDGRCEAVGYCSYPDDTCDSGRRFSGFAAEEFSRGCVLPDGDAATTSDDSTSTSTTNDASTSSSTTLSSSGASTSSDGSSAGETLAQRCGDGVQDPDEQCDDANLEPGDGCSPRCVLSGSVIWERHIEASRGADDVAHGVAVGVGGELIIAGGTGIDAMGTMLLARCPDDGGDCLVWTRSGEVEGNTSAFAVAAFGDGSFVVGGRERFGSSDGQVRGWAGRVDVAEEVQWSVPFGLGDDAAVFGVGIDASGQVTVVGQTAGEARIERLSPDGQPVSLTYYGAEGAAARAVATSSAGEAVVVGSEFGPQGSLDVWLGRYSATGAAQPVVHFAGPEGSSDIAHDVAILPNGDVAVVGESQGAGWISWFAVGGVVPIRNRTVDGTQVLRAVSSTSDGDVITVGDADEDEAARGWVGRFDADGNERWRSASVATASEHYRAVVATDDRRVFIAGDVVNGDDVDAVLFEVTP